MKTSFHFPLVLLCSLAIAFAAAPLSASSDEMDSLRVGATGKLRTPASAWPEDLGKEFSVQAPEDRSPASTKIAKARNKKLKPDPQASTVQAPGSRRSRLPAKITEGIEFRARYEGMTMTYWIVKRDGRIELLFSNSAATKSAVTLSEEKFVFLQNLLRSFEPSEAKLSKCPEASMQAYLVEGKKEKAMSACALGKSRSTLELRQLAGVLASFIQ